MPAGCCGRRRIVSRPQCPPPKRPCLLRLTRNGKVLDFASLVTQDLERDEPAELAYRSMGLLHMRCLVSNLAVFPDRRGRTFRWAVSLPGAHHARLYGQAALGTSGISLIVTLVTSSREPPAASRHPQPPTAPTCCLARQRLQLPVLMVLPRFPC